MAFCMFTRGYIHMLLLQLYMAWIAGNGAVATPGRQSARNKFFLSLDWFKGKSTGNHGFYNWIWGFPVNFPLNQSIDLVIFWWQ
jgi:hypothetical protein